MARIVLVAGAAVTFLLASMAAGEASAQARGGTGTTGGTGGGSAFGATTGGGGFGQTSTGTGQTNSGLGGLATGYGGAAGGQQQQQQQNRNLTQTLNQNRTQLATQAVTIQNQVPARIQIPTVTPRPATLAAAAPMQGKLGRVMATRGVASATAMWEGDVLVLSGNVANESVCRQIEGIALLQPGVRTVRNDTVVGPVPDITTAGN